MRRDGHGVWFARFGVRLRAESGSFECNPPFDEAIISKLAGHTERMLASRKDPLSFCVVVPKWTESQAWMRLAKSVYCTENVTLEAKEHAFVS